MFFFGAHTFETESMNAMGRLSWVNNTCGKPHVSIQTYLRNLCGSLGFCWDYAVPPSDLTVCSVVCLRLHPIIPVSFRACEENMNHGYECGIWWGGQVVLYLHKSRDRQPILLKRTQYHWWILNITFLHSPQSTIVPHPKRRMPGPSHKAKRLAWRYGRGDAWGWKKHSLRLNDFCGIMKYIYKGMMCILIIDACLWHTVGCQCCAPYIVSATYPVSLLIRICAYIRYSVPLNVLYLDLG